MTNFRPIKKGDTYSFTIEAFTDETETTPVDISGYSFAMVATYSGGTNAFTKNNADFVSTTNFKRTFTLDKTQTEALTVGELYYQIDVTYPDTTHEEWSDGYIIVKA
jgi:hypothetical protein